MSSTYVLQIYMTPTLQPIHPDHVSITALRRHRPQLIWRHWSRVWPWQRTRCTCWIAGNNDWATGNEGGDGYYSGEVRGVNYQFAKDWWRDGIYLNPTVVNDTGAVLKIFYWWSSPEETEWASGVNSIHTRGNANNLKHVGQCLDENSRSCYTRRRPRRDLQCWKKIINLWINSSRSDSTLSPCQGFVIPFFHHLHLTITSTDHGCASVVRYQNVKRFTSR